MSLYEGRTTYFSSVSSGLLSLSDPLGVVVAGVRNPSDEATAELEPDGLRADAAVAAANRSLIEFVTAVLTSAADMLLPSTNTNERYNAMS